MKLKIKGTDNQKAKQYPSIGDQLDALWKVIKHNDIVIPPEALGVFNGIQDAKKAMKRLSFIKE